MPSKDDKFENEHCRIKVNPSGGYFHLYKEGDIDEVNLTDIASALSRQCRFTGHLLDGVELYSVAEHSVLVSYILEEMGAPPEVLFQGLMHDSAEAYLSDIAAPFKRELGQYYEKEELIQKRVNSRFNLPNTMDPLVKVADWYALFIEARQIVVPDEKDLATWTGYEDGPGEGFGIESKKYQKQIQCWYPGEARKQFLIRFAQLIDNLYAHPELL